MNANKGLKTALHARCHAIVAERIRNAKEAMESAQEAANEETKSSAGDKYETGREMMQQEMENNAIQLGEAKKLKEVLEKINPEKSYETVQAGSIVFTTNGNFYLSVGLGKLHIEGVDYFAIAPTSPLGSMLMNKKVADTVEVNGRAYQIQNLI